MMSKSESRRAARRVPPAWMRWSALASAGLTLSIGAASCGGSAGGGAGGALIQSNTNWLQRCGPGAPCSGALLCLCGMCTQPCAETLECGRLEGATCGGSCGEAAPAGGGMCVLGCTGDDQCGEGFVCQAAECRPRPPALDERALGDEQVGTAGACSNAFVSLDSVFEHARLDLQAQDADDQPFLRYLSLANRSDAGACESELSLERVALAKLLNSTSTRTTLVQPTPVDAGQLLYRVDLRDYGWERPRSLAGREYRDAWELLAQNMPYGIAFEGPDASALADGTGSAMPLLQADALVYAAARGETYMQLLEQPTALNELLSELGVELQANRRDGAAWRVATTRSRISRASRVLERHELEVRAGSLWLTLDFFSDSGPDILQSPLAVDPSGGTLLYTLPNGLPAFGIYDDSGLLSADSDILLDTNQNNFRALTAVSCMTCHTDTILPAVDEVASRVASNPADYTAGDRQAIARMYPGADVLLGLMASDNARFRGALEQIGADGGSSEPVSSVVSRFEGALTPSDIAGDLLLPQEDLAALPELARVTSRSDFEARLVANLCTSLVSARNRPLACAR